MEEKIGKARELFQILESKQGRALAENLRKFVFIQESLVNIKKQIKVIVKN